MQIALNLNRKLLDINGILYPKAGTSGKTAHHDLAYSLHPRLKRNDYVESIEKIKNEVRENHHTVIISSEAFQNIQVIDRVQLLIATLKPERTQIICYFREFVDYCIASYAQRVQAQASFIPFQKLVEDMGGFSVEDFVERWGTIGDMKLLWFDRSKLINMDIIDDFFNQIGFPSLVAELEKYPSNPNPSIGGNLLFFKNSANFYGRKFINYQSMSKLASTFASFRSPIFIPAEHTEMLRKNSNYNHFLLNKLGPLVMKDWSSYPSIPNLTSLQSDIEKILLFSPEIEHSLLNELAQPASNENSWFKIEPI